MNIIFFIDQVYLHGGIERVLSIKANYLAKNINHKVYIITTEQKNKVSCYLFDDKITFIDLNVNYFRNKSYFHPKNLLKLPRHISKAKHLLKKLKPNVVVVCSHSTDTYFIPFVETHIPKVKEFHYSKSIEIEHRKKSKISFKKYFIKFADYVETKYDKLVVLNADEAKYYKSNNTITIPNPLTFHPKAISSLNDKVIISAGRVAPVKRFDILIDIWELIHEKHSDWQLHIYGTGEPSYVNSLQQKIIDKKLFNNVFLKGATDDIQSKMLHSSLFVMTSENECFPLVLLEAQACGLPIIAFDCPHGPRNIIDKKSGRLIEMSDIQEFCKAISEIIENPLQRYELGKNARLNAANYNVDKIMKIWTTMFKELTKIKI